MGLKMSLADGSEAWFPWITRFDFCQGSSNPLIFIEVDVPISSGCKEWPGPKGTIWEKVDRGWLHPRYQFWMIAENGTVWCKPSGGEMDWDVIQTRHMLIPHPLLLYLSLLNGLEHTHTHLLVQIRMFIVLIGMFHLDVLFFGLDPNVCGSNLHPTTVTIFMAKPNPNCCHSKECFVVVVVVVVAVVVVVVVVVVAVMISSFDVFALRLVGL